MIAKCGCRVKSYRAKQCPRCGEWFCPACYSEHIASLETYCLIRDKPKLASFIDLEKKLAIVQKLPITSNPIGGTFRLIDRNRTTNSILFDATTEGIKYVLYKAPPKEQQ